MQIKPLFEKVLIKPLKKDKEDKKGIVLPDSVREEHTLEGIVIATGDGDILPVTVIMQPGGIPQLASSPMIVKVNDRVLFDNRDGTILKRDNEDHYLLSQREIMAKIID